MKPSNISVLLAFCISAGVFFSSSVFAKDTPIEDITTLGSNVEIPVMFKEHTMAKSVDEPHTAVDARIDKYQEGTLIGNSLDGLAKVKINGRIMFVHPEAFAYGDSEVSALARQKADEEQEAARLKEEEEKKKAEAEKAEREAREAEERRKAEEEAAAAAKEAEAGRQAAAAAQPAAPAPVQTPAAPVDNGGWSGSVLSPMAGVNMGPSGKETYYNLPMDGVIATMRRMGNNDPYWVRADGVKMLGNYVMVAANLSIRPRGSLVPTSLGMGIVCDTGGFAYSNPTQLDIAVSW